VGKRQVITFLYSLYLTVPLCLESTEHDNEITFEIYALYQVESVLSPIIIELA